MWNVLIIKVNFYLSQKNINVYARHFIHLFTNLTHLKFEKFNFEKISIFSFFLYLHYVTYLCAKFHLSLYKALYTWNQGLPDGEKRGKWCKCTTHENIFNINNLDFANKT